MRKVCQDKQLSVLQLEFKVIHISSQTEHLSVEFIGVTSIYWDNIEQHWSSNRYKQKENNIIKKGTI